MFGKFLKCHNIYSCQHHPETSQIKIKFSLRVHVTVAQWRRKFMAQNMRVLFWRDNFKESENSQYSNYSDEK